jgi:hypothetical protein
MHPKRLQQNITYIDVLAKAKPSQRKAILETADNELILCLCECILNIINGNIPLKAQELSKLIKHKTNLRHLASLKTPTKRRREILVQKGGFLPAVLMPILGIASQLLADAIIKR